MNERVTNAEKCRRRRAANRQEYNAYMREYLRRRKTLQPPLPPKPCLNCDSMFNPTRKNALFCGERCRQIAEWVRYARRKIADGTFDRSDIRDAIQSRLSALIVGFYDKRGERFVADETRERLKSMGKCEKCGRLFTPNGDARFTVQHIREAGGFRLEAWCYGCNMIHAQSVVRSLPDEEASFVGDCLARARAAKPLRDCDDEVGWTVKWRAMTKPPVIESSN